MVQDYETRCKDLSMKALKAKLNRDMAKYYHYIGQLKLLHAEHTGDNSELTGKNASRNRFY